MCTYLTEKIGLERQRQGRAPAGSRSSEATVYFDHPVHARPSTPSTSTSSTRRGGPSARVAVELTAESARAWPRPSRRRWPPRPPGSPPVGVASPRPEASLLPGRR